MQGSTGMDGIFLPHAAKSYVKSREPIKGILRFNVTIGLRRNNITSLNGSQEMSGTDATAVSPSGCCLPRPGQHFRFPGNVRV